MLTLNKNFEIMHEVDGYCGEVNGYSSLDIDGLKNYRFCILNGIDGWTLVGWCEGVRRVLCVHHTAEKCVEYLSECMNSTELAIYKDETIL